MTRASRISRHHSASSWFNVNHSRPDLSGRWPSRLVATANPAGVLVFRTERAAPAPRETSAGRTSLPGAFAGQRPDRHKKDRRRGGRTHVALRQSPSFFCGQARDPTFHPKNNNGSLSMRVALSAHAGKGCKGFLHPPRLASRLRQWRSQEPGGHPNSRLKPSKRLRKWWRKG
jgi:hypothetical protein